MPEPFAQPEQRGRPRRANSLAARPAEYEHFITCLVLGFALVILAPTVRSEPVTQSAEQLLPERLGPAQLTRKQQLQPEAHGVVFQYASGTQLWGTIVVFDFGIKDISTALSDPTVLKAYLRAEQEIHALVRLGRVKAARIPEQAPRLVEPKPCGRPYLRKDLEVEVQEGTNASYLALTTVRGKFVKVRISHAIEDEMAKAGAETFLEELAVALGACR